MIYQTSLIYHLIVKKDSSKNHVFTKSHPTIDISFFSSISLSDTEYYDNYVLRI